MPKKKQDIETIKFEEVKEKEGAANAQNSGTSEKEAKGSFFDPADIEDFTNEFTQEKEEASSNGFDIEDEDIEAAETISIPDMDAGNAEIFMMLLGLFDETRAIGAALISGQDKEKYLYYKNLKKDHYMVQAGARVVSKYQLQNSPEWILAFGLIGSTLFVGNMAFKDKRKQEQKEEEQTSEKQNFRRDFNGQYNKMK